MHCLVKHKFVPCFFQMKNKPYMTAQIISASLVLISRLKTYGKVGRGTE